MEALEKIQKLPKTKRKIILWTLLVILALVLLNFWLRDLKQRYQGLNIAAPSFEKDINLPNLEIPNINEEQ